MDGWDIGVVQDLHDILNDPELGTAFSPVLLSLLVSVVLGILVHEAGHAVFGRLAGFRIRLIRFGRGPVLCRLQLGAGLLVWHLFPISGAVATYRPLVSVRRARLILLAGGSLANAVTAVVIAALLPWPPDPQTYPFLTLIVLVQAGFAILNLIVVIGPGRAGTTDGGLVRSTLRQPSRVIDRRLARLYESHVAERTRDLAEEPPSALAAVVLHALVIGTPEATYTSLEALGTIRATHQGSRLRAWLLAQGNLTRRERAALLDS